VTRNTFKSAKLPSSDHSFAQWEISPTWSIAGRDISTEETGELVPADESEELVVVMLVYFQVWTGVILKVK
jgi:hypothetical protein